VLTVSCKPLRETESRNQRSTFVRRPTDILRLASKKKKQKKHRCTPRLKLNVIEHDINDMKFRLVARCALWRQHAVAKSSKKNEDAVRASKYQPTLSYK
jgi:ribosomal protein L34E